MKRVTALGGVFFKADNPEKLYTWDAEALGLQRQGQEAVVFNWRQADKPEKSGMTVWAAFPKDTKYFDPSPSSFMMNFVVEDLDGLLARFAKKALRSTRNGGLRLRPLRLDHASGRQPY